MRFAIAGTLLLLWRHYRSGVAWPTRREWLGGAGVGACLVLLSNVAVVFAERTIPSGVTALFAAGTPLLIALFNGHRTGTSLGRRRAFGLGLGTAGMILLGSATFASVHALTPLLLMALASIAWAIGSHSGNPHVAGKGKSGVLVALGAAFLIGGATFLVNFFNTQGGHLS